MNYGVILGTKPENWVAGANSKIVYEVRNPSGDWTDFCPPGEVQYSTRVDFMDCVTRSTLNSIEIQEKFLTGEQYDYCERLAAKRNGTTQKGNYMYNGPEQVRQEGLVLEEHYPDTLNGTWEEQYADIPEPLLSELLAEGKKWKEKWLVQYEQIAVSKESFLHHLKQAPIHIAMYEPAHATVNILCPADVVKYFDSYNPWIKETEWANVAYAQKIVLTRKENMAKRFFVKDGEKIGAFVADGFALGGAFAKDSGALESLKSALEFKGDEPTLELPPVNNL